MNPSIFFILFTPQKVRFLAFEPKMVVATIQIMPRVTKQEYTHYLPALTS